MREQSVSGKLFDTGENVEVEIEKGRISSIRPKSLHSRSDSKKELWLSPGFIDLQINGYGGHDLNADDPSPAAVCRLVQRLWETGVSQVLLSIVTGSHERLLKAMQAVKQACEDDPLVAASVLGIHLEGPSISEQDGPRGAHPKQHVRDPDWAEFQSLQNQSGGRIKMVTLAPERPGAIPFIRRLVADGIVAAIGHTAADEETIRLAVEAGATMSTHLGNGSHPVLPRHHNYLWSQLVNDSLWAGLIADGHHLPGSLLKCFVRCKLGKVVLVSDAVSLAGLPAGRYMANIGNEVELLPNGRLQVAEHPEILAGAAAGLDRGVENMVRFAGMKLAESVRLVTRNPALVLGRSDLGELVPGNPANLTWFAWDEESGTIAVAGTMVQGQIVYQNPNAACLNGLKSVDAEKGGGRLSC